MSNETISDFSEIEWLNSYFEKPEQVIEKDKIESILFFALMWNMFESIACRKFASVQSIQDKVNNTYSLLNISDFTPYLDYFRDRYLTDNQTNERFNSLNFRRNEKREIVEATLKDELNDVNNIVLSLLLIVYRLRNNLFHGEKDIYKLEYQIDNFKVANQILATFLTSIKNRN